MSFLEKYRNLVEQLYQQTEAGTLEWKNDDFGGGVTASFGNYRVKLSDRKDSDGEPFEIIEVVDIYNTTIDKFEDIDLKDVTPRAINENNYFLAMRNLRRSASRIASGADSALDEILKALDDNTSSGS